MCNGLSYERGIRVLSNAYKIYKKAYTCNRETVVKKRSLFNTFTAFGKVESFLKFPKFFVIV